MNFINVTKLVTGTRNARLLNTGLMAMVAIFSLEKVSLETRKATTMLTAMSREIVLLSDSDKNKVDAEMQRIKNKRTGKPKVVLKHLRHAKPNVGMILNA